jgi:16S rRNA (cytosine967-C5)-methyltransferase
MQAVVRVGIDMGCLFDEPFLPDPQTESAEYLSESHSLPLWLIKAWSTELGLDTTQEVALACNRRPGLYLRVNPLKSSQDTLLAEMHAQGIRCEPLNHHMICVHGAGDVTALPGFKGGCFMVQDLTASRVIPVLAPQGKTMILDLCAAPGTKTTHLAEVTADQATIVATDVRAKRLANIRENAQRLGLQSICVLAYDKIDEYVQKHGLFDAVLLDVPCSNTGVMARRVEVRYRLHQRDIDGLIQTQAALLDRAATLIKPGGKLCYSTCSILRQENEEQVKAFLKQHSTFALTQEALTLPTSCAPDHDGGYVAVLGKSPD